MSGFTSLYLFTKFKSSSYFLVLAFYLLNLMLYNIFSLKNTVLDDKNGKFNWKIKTLVVFKCVENRINTM